MNEHKTRDQRQQPKAKLVFEIDLNLYNMFKDKCFEDRITMSRVARRLVEQYVYPEISDPTA